MADADTPVVEHCRQWLPDKADNCNAPAVVIVWGKLFDAKELGPRCGAHLPDRMRPMGLGINQWAVFDLRGLYRRPTNA
jgi:hypothetical protein